MRWIIFETTVSRGIMGGRDDDTISQGLAAVFAVPAQDGMGDRGGRRGGAVVGDAHLDIIGCQDFKSAAKGRFRQGVRIPAHEQRAGDAVLFAVIADGLGDGMDVAFVEGLFQRGATVPGCTKGHTLRSLVRIGGFRVVGTDERGNIFQCLGRRQLAGMGMYCHDVSSCPFSTVSPADPQASKKERGPCRPPVIICLDYLPPVTGTARKIFSPRRLICSMTAPRLLPSPVTIFDRSSGEDTV